VSLDDSDDVPLALAELARVLRPGGRLVAVTNSVQHLLELRDLVGSPQPEWTFSAENGEELLRASFRSVERREAYGWLEFPGRAEVETYLAASVTLLGERSLPVELEGPFRVRRAPVVFVADR
jgi:SAM-dependent methyltransferase